MNLVRSMWKSSAAGLLLYASLSPRLSSDHALTFGEHDVAVLTRLTFAALRVPESWLSSDDAPILCEHDAAVLTRLTSVHQ